MTSFCWCLTRGQYDRRTRSRVCGAVSFLQVNSLVLKLQQNIPTRRKFPLNNAWEERLSGRGSLFTSVQRWRRDVQHPEKTHYCWQTGGDVSPLTFSGKLLQVLQCDLFVPRAVCQAVIDHCVLKGNKHSLVTDTQRGKKGTTWTCAALQMWV